MTVLRRPFDRFSELFTERNGVGMADEMQSGNQGSSDGPSGLDRRQFVKRGTLLSGAVGAAWAAPTVFDSFASPAAAATIPSGTVLIDESNPGTSLVEIPANRQVAFELVGGGGGGGGFYSFCGGSGTKVTGTLAAQASAYTLTYTVASGGGGGQAYINGSSGYLGGTGGSGLRPGGAGGRTNAGGPGAGGGGGGATAIYVGSPAAPTAPYVIAPGGGGTGGGGNRGASYTGGKHPASASGPLDQPGGSGLTGGEGTADGGDGGPVSGTAAGGSGGNGNDGTNGTIAGGGPGGAGTGGGGGGGGGGWVGGGEADILGFPGASGGSGSATRLGTFTVAPTATAADNSSPNNTTVVGTGPVTAAPAAGEATTNPVVRAATATSNSRWSDRPGFAAPRSRFPPSSYKSRRHQRLSFTLTRAAHPACRGRSPA